MNNGIYMKMVLVSAVLLQIALAIVSEGLIRSLAELTAFVLTVALIISIKKAKQQNCSASIQ